MQKKTNEDGPLPLFMPSFPPALVLQHSLHHTRAQLVTQQSCFQPLHEYFSICTSAYCAGMDDTLP